MARGNSIIPSSSDDSDSSDEDKPSVDELVYVVNFFEDVCPKQKVQLKVLKSKLLSFQNNYKYLLDKFETFANLNCELTTKIEQLESKTPSLTIDNNLVKKNEKLKAKLASSQDAIENLLEKMKILSIHDSELTTKLENISSTPKSILSRNS
jgi:chromosome segregation ATPase